MALWVHDTSSTGLFVRLTIAARSCSYEIGVSSSSTGIQKIAITDSLGKGLYKKYKIEVTNNLLSIYLTSAAMTVIIFFN